MRPQLVVDNGPIRKVTTMTIEPISPDVAFRQIFGVMAASYLFALAIGQIMCGTHIAIMSHILTPR